MPGKGCCGIGSIFSEPAHRDGGHARELVDRLLGEAARDGAAMALLFSDMSDEQQPAGFEVV
jgi:predicted acetyltransferase